MSTDPILVVDDIVSARKLYSTLLSQKGHRVKDVANGLAAIDIIKEEDFSLIITDINMPRIDGLGLLTWLQKRGRDTPVIVISALSDKKTVLTTAQFNVNKFFTKPINTSEFLKAVRDIVGDVDNNHNSNTPLPTITSTGNTSSFKQAMSRFSQKNSSVSTVAPYTAVNFIQELLDISEEDLKKYDFSSLQKIKHELEIWKYSPQLEERIQVFRLAFQKGSLPIQLLCVEYLPDTLTPDELIKFYKEWIFAKDHRVRGKVVERLAGLKHKEAIKILLACEQDNVKAIQTQAENILQKHRLSHLVIPIIIHYSERNLPLSIKYNKLLFHTNNQLVFYELKSFIKKANPTQLCYLADIISRSQWHDGLQILFNLSSNKSEQVRLRTVEAIGRFKEYATTIHMIKMFNDPMLEVRQAALKSISESTLIKNGTQLYLFLFKPNLEGAWQILADIVRDLERSSSTLLDFCDNLHGSSLEKRLENLVKLQQENPIKFSKHIKKLLAASDREKSAAVIQFLRDFNYE